MVQGTKAWGWMLAMAGAIAPACDDGGTGAQVVARSLVSEPGTPQMAGLQLVGATDWQATGRSPLQMYVVIDGAPVGWELGGEPIVAFEGSAVGFSLPSGTGHVQLLRGSEVVWDLGEHTFERDTLTTLVYFGGPSDPRVMALDDVTDVPEGHAAARVVNLDEARAPVDALLCPEDLSRHDACEVVAEGLAYGEAWTGTVATADRKVVAWERTRPDGYPLDRFIGSDPYPVGHTSCFGPALRTTTTLIPVHFDTPVTAPQCAFCTSGWNFGGGRAPGDCAW